MLVEQTSVMVTGEGAGRSGRYLGNGGEVVPAWDKIPNLSHGLPRSPRR
jgi:hypothetical protein